MKLLQDLKTRSPTLTQYVVMTNPGKMKTISTHSQ
jgi:hypothetical protein